MKMIKKYEFKKIIGVLAVLLFLAGISVPFTRAAATEPYGLSAMQQFDRLPYLKADTMAGGQSSFDRSGGNGDTGVYLYTDGSDKVMLDLKGPGTVYRIWTTGQGGSDYIKVYFDGETTPRINMLLNNLFTGTNAPFLSPLVGNNTVSSGGFYCYLPLPFRQSIKIETNGSFYYNIGYHLYSPDTSITSWTGTEDSSVVRTMWNSAGADPKSDSGNTTVTNTVNLAAGATQTLLNTSGPRSISSIKLRIPGVEAGSSQSVTDDGKAHKGYSQFVAALNSSNQGVTLKRRLDFGIANQKANVYVDGALVGEWYTPGSDTSYNWRDSSFTIPSTFTAGKSSITIKVVFVSSANDWNEFYYWVYSKVGGNDTLTDSVDVANSTSESSHGYVINTQTWTGSRSYQYPPTGVDATDILNNVKLRIYWDNESTPSVDAPLGSFFAMGQFGVYATRALPVGIDANNYMYVYFPMPFASNAKVDLVSQRSTSTDNITFEIKHKAFTDFTNVGYFKTFFNPQSHTAGDGGDILILDVEGSGNFLGVVESMQGNTTSRWYLEGDERIYVDESQSPAFYGTGTEDFYNGGWYFNAGLFTRPMHGNTAHVIDSVDKTTAYRLLLQDAIPFKKHIRAGIEHGANDDATENVWTLAYYYFKSNVRATVTDTLDAGNTSSESSHSYSINNQTYSGSLTNTYDGDFDTTSVTDDGRAFTGYSQFNMAIDSSNTGVMLRRRFDQSVANQQATVFVDGAQVGTWYKAGSNSSHKWRDEEFMIPASYTSGKSQIQVKIQFVAGTAWNEYRYTAYSCNGSSGPTATPAPTPTPTPTATPGGPTATPGIGNSKSDTNNLAQTGTGRAALFTVDHFGNALTIMTDGVKTGDTNDDSWNGQLKSEDYWGISFNQNYGFNKVIYTTGKMFVDGGWFSSGLKVQVRQNSTWVDVSGLNIAPAYPYNNTAGPNKSYTMTFNDTWGDAIRIDGVPVQVSGYAFSFTSVGELEIYYATSGATSTPTATATPTPIVTPTPTPTAAPTATPVTGSDDFNSSTLGSQWSWVREDNTHWSLTAASGYMRITTQAGDIFGTGNTAKNILLQNAPVGDWSIVTKLTFPAKPSQNYQQSGLIVYQNDDNYVKLIRIYSGNNYSGYYSVDGVSYTQVGSTQTVSLSPIKVGLVSFGGVEINADFDYFNIN
jgi:hypothetical protein